MENFADLIKKPPSCSLTADLTVKALDRSLNCTDDLFPLLHVRKVILLQNGHWTDDISPKKKTFPLTVRHFGFSKI